MGKQESDKIQLREVQSPDAGGGKIPMPQSSLGQSYWKTNLQKDLKALVSKSIMMQ